MLMQNFKSAADLGLTEPQKEALMKTLVLLETGKLKHVPAHLIKEYSRATNTFEGKSFDGYFNMEHSFATADCGTVACIRGTAMMVGRVTFPSGQMTDGLQALFYAWAGNDPGEAAAARALRNFLSTGEPSWKAAVAAVA